MAATNGFFGNLQGPFAADEELFTKIQSECKDNIAEKYNLVVIDNSDLTTGRMPKLHADINNPHFCKNGNAFITNRYIQELTKYFAQDPMCCEYHYIIQTNII